MRRLIFPLLVLAALLVAPALAGGDILKTYKSRYKSDAFLSEREAVIDGRPVNYRLHDRELHLLKGELRLRQVTRLCDDGHQTQVVTSRWDLSDIEVAYRMFDRWRQENFFKYMREEFLLDALVDYHVEPDDPTRTVPNPARKALDTRIRTTRAEVTKLEHTCGLAALRDVKENRPTGLGLKRRRSGPSRGSTER